VITLNERFRLILASTHQMLKDNVASLTLDEALFAATGHRSILGVLKHIGGWAHVYRSYAFDAEPKHWAKTSWPRGLRDTVEVSKDYVDEVIAWIDEAMRRWDEDLAPLDDAELDQPRPVHWGASAPLASIVMMVANHLAYHTGELNMLLSIARGEAWEYGEEVEENHIDTYGHGVRGPWMTDEIAKHYEDALRAAHEARQAHAL
jgi:uncharacterized damage-inducible protein DinB